MNVSSHPATIMFGPGYIGLVVATFLYGIEICQFAFYLRVFRCDKVIMKLQVYTVAALDTAHYFAMLATFYELLISCHADTSPRCSYDVPRVVILAVFLVYCITFLVQTFYAHRVWIISGQSIIITVAVQASATLQLLFGLIFVVEVIRTPTNAVFYSSPYSPLSSVASATCDATITLSVIYYLRPANIRRENFIKKLLIIFVQMGLFTFINSLALAVLYYMQNDTLPQFLTAAPGVILSKSYVNSMLSVLNARKLIRDQQRNARANPIELPTIPTLH